MDDKNQNQFLDEYSKAKQELFEVKVRNEFLEKEKDKIKSDFDQKDSEL